jgi:hypothetical protein
MKVGPSSCVSLHEPTITARARQLLLPYRPTRSSKHQGPKFNVLRRGQHEQREPDKTRTNALCAPYISLVHRAVYERKRYVIMY